MSECVMCGEVMQVKLSLQFIFSFQAIKSSAACASCLGRFKGINSQESCVGCSGVFEVGEGDYCGDCLRWLRGDTLLNLNHTALYVYDKEAQEYMKRFKYQGDVVLARVFAEKIGEQLKAYEKTHLIVPIPASSKSKKARGFNQVEVMLEEAGVSFERLLVHIGEGKKQVQKSKEERIQTEQPFQLREGKKLTGRPIILIDDVYTTGRTLLHAQVLLREAAFAQQNKVTEIEVLSCSLFR